jgi:NAD(P)-dependent dehydrogenase (short-subunit alcohol dehydrogenase family)
VDLAGKVIVVTGAARGIGQAMADRFAREQPAALVLVDCGAGPWPAAGSQPAPQETHRIDVAIESEVHELVSSVLKRHGRIDLFCSNAGILVEGGIETDEAEWDRIWAVNVKSHLYAAKAVLPGMLVRGQGYLLQTVSAAGLLTSIRAAPYAVSKHAALALAEWLAVTYGDRGIGVSCLCPAFVRTSMIEPATGKMGEWMRETAIDPAVVAEVAVEGLRAERFLILPHPEIGEFFSRKANDYDRWLRGMRKLQASLLAE